MKKVQLVFPMVLLLIGFGCTQKNQDQPSEVAEVPVATEDTTTTTQEIDGDAQIVTSTVVERDLSKADSIDMEGVNEVVTSTADAEHTSDQNIGVVRYPFVDTILAYLEQNLQNSYEFSVGESDDPFSTFTGIIFDTPRIVPLTDGFFGTLYEIDPFMRSFFYPIRYDSYLSSCYNLKDGETDASIVPDAMKQAVEGDELLGYCDTGSKKLLVSRELVHNELVTFHLVRAEEGNAVYALPTQLSKGESGQMIIGLSDNDDLLIYFYLSVPFERMSVWTGYSVDTDQLLVEPVHECIGFVNKDELLEYDCTKEFTPS